MKHTRTPPETKLPAWSVFPELEPVAPGIAPVLRNGLRRSDARRRQKKIPVTDRHVKATTLSFTNMNQYGDLLVGYMRARKRTFIDLLHWDLCQTDGMEFDQYDTPLCRWVVIHEFGEVLGGIRLTPTTAKVGVYSYMLRDAQKGMLDNIPTDVLFFDAPVEKRVWEASRLFIADDVPAQRRVNIQSILMHQMIKASRELGATHVIGIVPSVWSRWLRRLDMNAVAVGPKFKVDDKVTSQAALFNVLKFFN